MQCTADDLYASRNAEDYCIDVCHRSGLFDCIVLAVPDQEESRAFDELVKPWQVELVKGPVFNVADRILLAMHGYDLDVAARILLRRFYLDSELVSEMIALLLSEGADYVRLPNDFNYELAADVFTRDALVRTRRLLTADDLGTAARQFSPWRLMDEDTRNFKTVEHPGSNSYPPQKVDAIKRKLRELLSENQVCYGWQFRASAYAYVSQYLARSDAVLDIACGQGHGARQLINSCATVVGVDRNLEYVSNARKKFSGMQGLSYVCEDAMAYVRPNGYDAIVCLHTLEHLSDPLTFLRLCHRNLKPNGRLFLEVPLLLPRPLGQPLNPYHEKEYTACELERLVELGGFKIDRRIGRDRGVYTEIDSAREAVQYHCSRA